MDPSSLTACEAIALIKRGQLSATTLIEACLARIKAREPGLKAWVYLDPEAALAQAQACDATGPKPPLYGVPVGVKDIIDTADMPTTYGSPIYHGHRPAADADCVTRVRAAGGITLGKTASTEFAYRHLFTGTRNPHNRAHTPGGSSSGSAAAVADHMIPLAFGTQTAGSIIRPASYCGVYGYKPTFNTFSLAGVKALAPGLDTLGHLARSVDDLALLASVLSAQIPAAVSEWSDGAPRIGIARMKEWSHAETATIQAVETAAQRLRDEGAFVDEITAPAGFGELGEIQKIIMDVEALSALATEHKQHREALSTELREILDRAALIPLARYEEAVGKARALRARVDELFADKDVLLTASASGEAPAGLDFTGDPVFNRVWTLLHVPCINLPYARGSQGLPVGIQLVGRLGDDVRLLSAAKWAAARLGI